MITVSRSKYTVQYPANFMLIAAMNPCPCGYYNHPTKACVCSPGAVFKYMNRISGPMLDRIDMHIEVIPVEFDELSRSGGEESSAVIRQRVVAARKIQSARFAGMSIHTNSMMNSRCLREFCPLSEESSVLLRRAMERFNLSARAYDRIIKVARTIADLAGTEQIETGTHRRSDRIQDARSRQLGEIEKRSVMLLSERLRITPFLKILPCFAAGIFAFGYVTAPDWVIVSATIVCYLLAWALRKSVWGGCYSAAALFMCGILVTAIAATREVMPRGVRLAMVLECERYAGHTGKMAADNGGCRIVPSDRCGCGYMDPDR